MIIVIVGNIFVIAAILVDRHLQIVANYLILSLAVADLLVAVLVMPLGAANSVSNHKISLINHKHKKLRCALKRCATHFMCWVQPKK